MCKLLIGLQLNETEEFNKIVSQEAFGLSTLPDGLGAITVGKDNKVLISRHNKDYRTVLKKFYSGITKAKLVGIHSRQATSGAISMDNVHFFKEGHYLMAHNGIVSGYSALASYKRKESGIVGFNGKAQPFNFQAVNKHYEKNKKHSRKTIDIGQWEEREVELKAVKKIFFDCNSCLYNTPCGRHKNNDQRMKKLEKMIERTEALWETLEDKYSKSEKRCDSLQFLQGLPSTEINTTILKKQITEKLFFGMGVLLDMLTNRVFIFTTRTIKVQTNFADYLLFYSYDPEEELTTNRSFLGLDFTLEDKKIQTFDLGEGIYEFSYADNNFEMVAPAISSKVLVQA